MRCVAREATRGAATYFATTLTPRKQSKSCPKTAGMTNKMASMDSILLSATSERCSSKPGGAGATVQPLPLCAKRHWTHRGQPFHRPLWLPCVSPHNECDQGKPRAGSFMRLNAVVAACAYKEECYVQLSQRDECVCMCVVMCSECLNGIFCFADRACLRLHINM